MSADLEAPTGDVIQAPLAAAEAPPASARLEVTAEGAAFAAQLESYFEGADGRRVHMMTDKPLYQPGETIWVRSWDLGARELSGSQAGGITYTLISPRGSTLLEKHVQQQGGEATNDFALPEGLQGGEYTLRATTHDGHTAERPLIVSAYEAPRIKKTLEFMRDAYGPGDEVAATIEVERATGEALGGRTLSADVRIDGEALPRVQVVTNDSGGAVVRFRLPDAMRRGDAVLTVLVPDGGVTESISRRIPVVLGKMQVQFFPEGGELVAGLPSRVYLEAKDTLGEPADVVGRVVDDRGEVVVERVESLHGGLGRFALTPEAGRSYRFEVSEPRGIAETYTLPMAKHDGCVMQHHDDPDGALTATRVSVWCTQTQPVVVTGVMRDQALDTARVEAGPQAPGVVYLEPEAPALARAQGVARVTVFDDAMAPQAERLVYRNRRNRLELEVSADRERYSPRDAVTLSIRATDSSGAPVEGARLAMAVVDDSVISRADDKTGHILSRLLLEPELPGEVDEPNFYLDLTEADGAQALDMLMGTRGWRTFEWRPIATGTWGQQRAQEQAARQRVANELLYGQADLPGDAFDADFERLEDAAPAPDAAEMPVALAEAEPEVEEAPVGGEADPAPPVPPAAPRPEPVQQALEQQAHEQQAQRQAQPVEQEIAEPMAGPMAAGDEPVMDRLDAGIAQRRARRQAMGGGGVALGARGLGWDGGGGRGRGAMAGGIAMNQRRVIEWAPVRVFPAPDYSGEAGQAAVREDFRETIHWSPSVTTDAEGAAQVTFYMSDAVTSFRVFTEGVGAGEVGRDETVLTSQRPFSMSVKLPLEVSEGDLVLMPLTLSNEMDAALTASVTPSFGSLVTLEEGGAALLEQAQAMRVSAGERTSVFWPLRVTGQEGQSEVRITARSERAADAFTRTLTVVPRGFPQHVERSGEVLGTVTHAIDLGAAVAGTSHSQLRLYPSPMASMIGGLEGLLREPSGCFEQTSSSNYPNIMVMRYMQAHDVADPALVERTRAMLARGYQRLVGYESPGNGYEWFGGAPAHEALTAYGLLEFVDMREVLPEVSEPMIARTAAWLRSRQDGEGGFLRDPKALDSFGQASPEVTNAYIVYSLSEAGFTDYEAGVARQAELARDTQDPYLLALAAGTLLNIPSRANEASAAVSRLVAMQAADGSWPGADHSITRSGGDNLLVETTALAMLALLDADAHRGAVEKAAGWLNANRGGFGQWGATQATVLSLKALTVYARASRRTRSSGVVRVLVDGAEVATVAYAEGHQGPIDVPDFGRLLGPGSHDVQIVHEGQEAMPYSLAVEFRSVTPATSAEAVVTLDTRLARDTLAMGETVRLEAVVRNTDAHNGQPMTMARVGFPAGLTSQTWQLKELRERGQIAFYETGPREVILYFRDMAPGEEKVIPIELEAVVPGRFEGPASTAYLYYTDEHKFWVDGLEVEVTP